MPAPSLLDQYDLAMRRDTQVAGCERIVTPELVRYRTQSGRCVYILWHQFEASEIARLIDREIAFASGLAREITWKVLSHDQPAERLAEALGARGFKPEEHSTLHVCSVDALLANTVPTRPGWEVREIADPSDMIALRRVWQAAWPDDDNDKYVDDYTPLVASRDPGVRFWYVAPDAAPASAAVATGYMFHTPGTPFALLCGGATVPTARGQGLYRSLIATRARAAAAQGARWMAIDASAASAPIVARLGFSPLAQVVFHTRVL